MSKMDGLSREQLEKMADGLSSVLLGFVMPTLRREF